MKLYHRISALLFIVFVLTLSIIFVILPDRTYSEKEKRNLAALPELTLSSLADGSFMDGIEDYTADQFPRRNDWMTVKTFMSRALGQNESQGVYLCKEDSLIERFDAPDPENTKETAESINSFVSRHPSSSFYFLLAPTAVTIYPERLPEDAPTDSEAAYMKEFNAMLSENISLINVSPRFTELKDRMALYYRTDHHWTTDAAYEAFLTAREVMNFQHISEFKKGVVCNSFYGSLTSESGFSVGKPDEISVYFPTEPASDDPSNGLYTVLYTDDTRRTASCYETEKLLEDDPYQVFFGGNHPLIEIRTGVTTDRSLLIIKDSYANCFIPFLLTEFKSITVLDPRYYYDNIDILTDASGFTDILFLYNASTLSEDTNLKTVLGNNQ